MSGGRTSSSRHPAVPPTAYAVMALLHRGGALSGYDVRQWAEQSLRHVAGSPAQSQIYRELGRLTDLGWVTSREVRQADRPDKTLHELTDAGRDALTEWIRDPAIEPTQVRNSTALRLFVGDLADSDVARRMLEDHVAAVERRLDDLETLVVALDGDHDARFAVAAIRWSVEIHRADRSGAMAVLTELDELYPNRPQR